MMQIGLWMNSVTTDLERALRYTMLWGLDGVELCMIKSNRVPNVNEAQLRHHLGWIEEEEEDLDDFWEEDEGEEDEEEEPMSITAIAPGLFECTVSDKLAWLNDLMLLDEAIRFCQRLNCSTIVVSSFGAEEGVSLTDALADMAKVLRRAGDKAAAHDMTLVVLNEGGMMAETGEALAELIQATNHAHVKAAWQPVVALQLGGDPQKGIEALIQVESSEVEGSEVESSAIGLVRVQNGKWNGKRWQHSALEQGDVNWQKQLQTLFSKEFEGILSLGVFTEDKGKQGLRDATYLIQSVRKVRKNLKSP